MNTYKPILTSIALFLLIPLFYACGGEESSDRQTSQPEVEEAGLSDFELEHGIGPVTEPVEIGEIDPDLVTKGRNIYEMKCEMCHNYQGRMVGPELGNVLERRSPEFVMNFILNPGGMTRDHPVGQELLREYMTVMPFQNVQRDEARAIVEYLRFYYEENY
ncbi:MAG: cytochrome c [Balneolaceae bacterium]|nr:cytochrome c [Balneolaceae bacterium]